MITLNRSFQVARQMLALSAALGLGVVVAQGQQAVTPTVTAAPTLNFQVQAASPDTNFSSSAMTNAVADEVADSTSPFSALMSADTQPPPRRGYSRPRYRGGNTNPDGSNKYGFLIGGGFTLPEGDDSNYLTPSWSFQIGGGRNFNKNFGIMAQFDWDAFGFKGSTLGNQSILYFGDTNEGLDGRSHIWSLTLNPTFNMVSSDTWGAYVVAGGGFYHKAANFFVPTEEEGCDEFECGTFAANATIQNYSSNSPGVNGGFGLTYKTSHFSNSRLYGEIRVVHTFNNYRPGITVNTPSTVADAYTGWNYFPQNSQETTYFPVKFGIRF